MITFLFPGQGSQSKGMGEALFDEFDKFTNKSDEILGFSIKELCLVDPEGKLNETQFAQPAIFVVNALSYYKKIDELGKKPDYVAGHSLGELNALFAAECFNFETGLKLVKKRSELMSQVKGGGMAAIINATNEKIQYLLKKSGLNSIELANFNSPSQIVISGMREEIEKAKSIFQNEKIIFIPLATSGAFHTKHMAPARKEFEKYLESFMFKDLKIPVISNLSAEPYKKDKIIQNLSQQITNPVKWHQSIIYLMKLKDMAFEEVGHGKTLTGLLKSIKNEQIKTLDQAGPAKYFHYNNKEKYKINAEEKVKLWNQSYPIGTKVKSKIVNDKELETRTEAMILFGHRAAVYMKGYNGYFDLDEIIPSAKQS
jgi:malonyl CoA-acyl carrier protein transacylase